MSLEEERSSQASLPAEPPQRRRRDGEHVGRMGRRGEGAASSRRKNGLALRTPPNNKALPKIHYL
ncbi:UNVERIFIED_CONTAM: hypothetical protein Slati_2516600 [Sesamum latifolium]|uniref:Uncharacterized protein n=1 Tax=Sesamum latifolium TaxID=2727402 RepID=A0AAW2WKK6_9LAMI